MNLRLGTQPRVWEIESNTLTYQVQEASRCLRCEGPLRPNCRGLTRLTGAIRRVRVLSTERGPKKIPTWFYYGRTDKLEWDPGRLRWPDPHNATKDTNLLGFSSRLGRELLKKRIVVNNPVTRKWQGVLYQGFRLKWKTVWERERTSKEAGLLWLV